MIDVLLLGIDVGTGGVRALVCDPAGAPAAHAEAAFPPRGSALPAGRHEQDPEAWWMATTDCLRQVVASLRKGDVPLSALAGLSVTSTSGTVCLVGAAGESLGPALMYNDGRAGAEAEEVNQIGRELAARLGYRFAASFALPKLLWLARHEPARFAAAQHLLSPTDFLIGRLTGRYDVTDYSNALKTGYDLLTGGWPAFIEDELRIPRDRLPAVVAPGTPLGAITTTAAAETGLPAGLAVLAGMTDGCASQVSTGAVAPGQWNSTLGTTLVIKGVTRRLLRDPLGRVYCHRHPDGYWLPGGASNTGGEALAERFGAQRLAALGEEALAHAPSDLIVYPLARAGERFPFAAPAARGFVLGEAADEATLYTAYLEGEAYVERLAYAVLAGLGAEVGDELYVAGGANHSPAWLQLRADILGKRLLVPARSGGAMGAAIIAAAGTLYAGIVPAARAMVRIKEEIVPRLAFSTRYTERYEQFCAALAQRGYLS